MATLLPGTEEGSTCNRPIEFTADFKPVLERSTESHCSGTMVLKAAELSQLTWLECTECGAEYGR